MTDVASVDLFRNKIVSKGAETLITALPQCKPLASVNLFRNGLQSAEAHALAALLPQCKTSSEGAKAVAAALPQYETLTSVDGSWNLNTNWFSK